jgi:hypothetical protein
VLAPRTERSRVRRRALFALVPALVVIAAAVCASRGSVEEFASRPVSAADLRRAPAWTRPCWGERLRDGRPLLAPCARVHGRVVYVNHEDPPSREVHAVLVARFGLVNAKFTASRRDLAPGLLDDVTIVGPMIRGGGGLREVYVWRIG